MGQLSTASAHGEAFRILRTNLEVALAEESHPSIILTSAKPGEGKTATTVNLARSLALAGRRVVLVDLDIRHPDTHRHLGVPNAEGVCDVLEGRSSLASCLRFIPLGSVEATTDLGLYFLSTGPPVANPAELLDNPRTGELIRALSQQADVVLIDTPPLLPVADTLVIGKLVSGAILVVETRKTPIGAVEQAQSALERNQIRTFGVIINKLQPKDALLGDQYGYGYGYGYAEQDNQDHGGVRSEPTAIDSPAVPSGKVPPVELNDRSDEPSAGQAEVLNGDG